MLIKAVIGHMDNALIHISRHAIMQNPTAGAAKKALVSQIGSPWKETKLF